jgi:hypothetical protein
MRHDKVCAHLLYSVCKTLGIEMVDKWSIHMPKPVYEQEDYTVLWNNGVNTNREVKTNGPDIKLKTKKRKHAS